MADRTKELEAENAALAAQVAVLVNAGNALLEHWKVFTDEKLNYGWGNQESAYYALAKHAQKDWAALETALSSLPDRVKAMVELRDASQFFKTVEAEKMFRGHAETLLRMVVSERDFLRFCQALAALDGQEAALSDLVMESAPLSWAMGLNDLEDARVWDMRAAAVIDDLPARAKAMVEAARLGIAAANWIPRGLYAEIDELKDLLGLPDRGEPMANPLAALDGLAKACKPEDGKRRRELSRTGRGSFIVNGLPDWEADMDELIRRLEEAGEGSRDAASLRARKEG